MARFPVAGEACLVQFFEVIRDEHFDVHFERFSGRVPEDLRSSRVPQDDLPGSLRDDDRVPNSFEEAADP
jgi:hypothetical protein